jgi:hypothetical protein
MERSAKFASLAVLIGCIAIALWMVACAGEPEKAKRSDTEKKVSLRPSIPAGKVVNLSPYAKATTNSEFQGPGSFSRHYVAEEGPGEWATEGPAKNIGAWIQLTWDSPVSVNCVELEDRPSLLERIMAGHLVFSDGGTTVPVQSLPDDGSPLEVVLEPRKVTWIRFVIDDVTSVTTCAGLRKFRVFGEKAATP